MQQQLGSGKTAVLVERIINKVVNENVDIDKILVVTFTNAAASEMRERILDAIYKKLEENPNSVNLQRQINLLNKASICTIHSFCLDVIKNNFFEIDTSANFRIGDTAEIEMLKSDVLEEIFEQKYMNNDKKFIKLLETYTDYKGDEKLQELILNIYKYIQSSPFPEKWLNEKVEEFNLDINKDFSETVWGKIILENIKIKIQDLILRLENIKKKSLKFPELEKYSNILQEDINNLESVKYDNWELAYFTMNGFSWKNWPTDKKITLELKDEAKENRTKIKEEYRAVIPKQNSNKANEEILFMYEILKSLKEIILEFGNEFSKRKKEKNIIDFNDIEHFALKILINDEGNKSEVAKKYTEKFEEILIDEYQDSNLVQEKILTSISNGNNIFMVGDVKQSIYKFRQARPELFLEKYEKYNLENKDGNGLKIQLFKNFRSRENVLHATNLIFENIMSKELGNVEYDKKEYLNLGADYPIPNEKINYAGITELHIIDLKEDKEDDIYKMPDLGLEKYAINDNEYLSQTDFEDENDEENNDKKDDEKIEDSILEARFVAKKIQELLKSDYKVYDKKMNDYRKIMAKDICVLLRATSVLAPIYEKEIAELNIPVFSDSSNTYLETMEVQTIMALLKVIDNPMQDIPLVTVLRSNIFGFNDNDLIQIRLSDKKCSFYEAMLKARISVDNKLREKIDNAISQIENLRIEEKYTPLNEFIWKIYLKTGFYDYVRLLPNGDLRQANLKLLFEKAKQYEKASFKGLYNFINFIDKVKINNGDSSSAKVIGENDNVVRIMSIHKSKGLEFPVVFLSNTGKRFNMQDLNAYILMHQDIGFGMQLIDSEKGIKYSTLSKEAIKIKSRNEIISEEMRVLYVALTRAREKLIITGMSRDLEKSLQDKDKIIETYQKNGVKINKNAVEKCLTYLDWIELVYKYNKNDIIDLHTYSKKDLLKQIIKEDDENIDIVDKIKKIAEKNKKENDSIKQLLEWQYEHIASSKIPTKTSVTKLKEIEQENDIEDLIKKVKERKGYKDDVESEMKKPKFIQNEKALTAAQKGTLIHLCVQKLDESKEYSKEDLCNFIEDLKNKNIISEKEAQGIDIEILYKYTKSELWNELKQAKEIHKEEPFYINIPAKEIYEEADENEKILVQGIIDLYYINKKGELILVDYKTDYVPNGKISKLEEKYKVQLDLYKKALEGALNTKVDKAMIWALSL